MEQVIIWILLTTSIIGLTVIIERGFALRADKIMPPLVTGALESCHGPGDLPMLQGICGQHPSALSRLILQASERLSWSKEENSSALETTARHEIARMERRLVILEIVVGVAPLLGLVGTIYGLIELFGGLSQSGLGDNSGVAKGIATALASTLLGLLTAIPSLVAWSYYTKKVEGHAVELATMCDSFLIRQYHEKQTEPVVLARERGR